MEERLADRLRRRKARIGIIGMGYVGLPLARLFSEAGYPTVGFDTDVRKVSSLQRGLSYIRHLPSALVKKMRERHRFRATTDFSQLGRVEVILICVPTPLTENREPDMSYICRTGEAISRNLCRGQLVVLESTTYPGTTRELLRPLLEKSGLACGRDFFLVYSPEREDPGSRVFSASRIPKVVGGINPSSRRLAERLYREVVPQVVTVSSCEVAEASKLLENIYRSVNIALVNEMKKLFDRMDIDVWEVIRAAATKPFGFHAFYPGPGLGGHCIPIDPFYLTWKARQFEMATRFIELAGEINTSMPQYVVERTAQALNRHGKALNGARVGVVGLAYKPDVDDARESPAIRILELLRESGARISYHDPFISRIPQTRQTRLRLRSSPLTASYVRGLDCVVIVTNHASIDYRWLLRQARLIVDTRNAIGELPGARQKVVKA